MTHDHFLRAGIRFEFGFLLFGISLTMESFAQPLGKLPQEKSI